MTFDAIPITLIKNNCLNTLKAEKFANLENPYAYLMEQSKSKSSSSAKAKASGKGS